VCGKKDKSAIIEKRKDSASWNGTQTGVLVGLALDIVTVAIGAL
jgi:hypothetical protein